MIFLKLFTVSRILWPLFQLQTFMDANYTMTNRVVGQYSCRHNQVIMIRPSIPILKPRPQPLLSNAPQTVFQYLRTKNSRVLPSCTNSYVIVILINPYFGTTRKGYVIRTKHLTIPCYFESLRNLLSCISSLA